MALDPVTLDDLAWNNLVQAAVARIPAASGGRWTLHAPVDPGVTLLELFAAQLEQRLYWMDHPADTFTRALLKLHGTAPRAAVCATTVFAFFDDADEEKPNSWQILPRIEADQVIEAQDPALRFTIRDPLTVLPLDRGSPPRGYRARQPLDSSNAVTLRVNGIDRTTDLRAGRCPCLLAPPATGSSQLATVRIILKLRQELPPPEGLETLGLLFDLVTPANLAPEWASDPPDPAGTPANLTWRYRVAPDDGTGDPFRPFPAADVVDGTDGLRRSGMVRLPRPGTDHPWIPEPQSDRHSYALEIRADQAHYSFWPRVRRIVPNAVRGMHQAPVVIDDATETTVKQQLAAWRREPGLTLVLPDADPTTGQLPLAERVQLLLYEQFDQQPHNWEPVADLAFYGPTDRVFVVDRAAATLRFGDGFQGRLPVPTDPPQFRLQYEAGGGPTGNVTASIRWRLAEEDPASPSPLVAVNAVPAAGGVEPESPDGAGSRFADEWRRPTRAITPADFEQLATHTPGVAIRRAHAVPGAHPEHPGIILAGAITVYLVPDLPAGPNGDPLTACPGEDLIALVPDPAALAKVQAYLNAARLVTQEVFVRPVPYQEVTLMVTVAGMPADAAGVRARLTAALDRYLHPLYGDWPFGGPVRPSGLLRVVQNNLDAGLRRSFKTKSWPGSYSS